MKLAFVFPGQGSQSVGMMQGYADFPVVQETFQQASTALGIDLWQLASAGPAEELNRTVITQPLMLTAGVAVLRAWRARQGPAPALLAGHSLGEYSALVAADALEFADAVKLVRLRAEAMQAAVPEGQGAIAAVLGLDDAQIEAACQSAAQGEVVEPANYNAPGQVVIAGHKSAVARAIEAAKAKGAKRAMLLPMSVPAHSALMKPAAERLASELARTSFRQPALPVIQNATLAAADSAEQIRRALQLQVYSPVRWVATIQALRQQGVTHVLECGPGKVLTGLTKRIDETLTCISLHDGKAIDDALAAVR